MWRTESLARSTKLKLFADAPSQPMRSLGLPGSSCGQTGEKSAVQIGSELLQHGSGMAPVTRSVRVRTFRDYNDGTEPEPCGFAISPGSEEKSYCSEGSEE